jgi:hypothetical protein
MERNVTKPFHEAKLNFWDNGRSELLAKLKGCIKIPGVAMPDSYRHAGD